MRTGLEQDGKRAFPTSIHESPTFLKCCEEPAQQPVGGGKLYLSLSNCIMIADQTWSLSHSTPPQRLEPVGIQI